MELIAIDPGTYESAFVHMKGGVIKKFGKIPNYDMENMIEEYKNIPTYIEFPVARHQIASNDLFVTCRWVGIFSAYLNLVSYVDRAFIQEWFQVRKRTRSEKKAGIKIPNADAQIRAKLIDMYGGDKSKAIGTKKAKGPLYGFSADMWQALAIAKAVECGGI